MSAHLIRQKASKFLLNTPGFSKIFFLPVLLSIFCNLTILYFYINNQNSHLTISQSLNQLIFSWSTSFLIFFMIISSNNTLLNILRHKNIKITWKDSFSAFTSPLFGYLLLTSIIKFLMIMLWSFIYILGIVAIKYNELIGLIITIIGVAIIINRYYAYGQVELLLLDNLISEQPIRPWALIRESSKGMKGIKFRKFCLDFSFIGWKILSIITFDLLKFFLLPYQTSANIIFYNEIFLPSKNNI